MISFIVTPESTEMAAKCFSIFILSSKSTHDLFSDIDAPVISSNVSKRVPENDYLVLNCNASAIPSVTGYMWYKDGKELTSETSSLLLLSPVKREDAANYICQATNAVGEKNSTSFSVIVSCKYESFTSFSLSL